MMQKASIPPKALIGMLSEDATERRVRTQLTMPIEPPTSCLVPQVGVTQILREPTEIAMRPDLP